MSKRLEQVESVLKRAVSGVLAHGLSDPRVTGMVSVTRLKVSPDLHGAYVYVSVMPHEQERKTLSGLRHAAGHIHALVRPRVDMRTVPKFEFRLDKTVKKQIDVLQSIRRGMEREASAPGLGDLSPPAASEDPDQ